MNIWIVTTGNSDVQLKNKTNWNNLYREGRRGLKRDHNFQPSQKEDDVIFTVPARVMGVIYGNQLDNNKVDKDIYQDLCFPLLDAFFQKLQGQNQPDRIIVIITNQEAAYTNPEKKSPYWKDTFTLKPILDKYFKIFPKIKEVEYLELKPESKDEGLDNWDQALKLVEAEFLKKFSDLVIEDIDNIYVSHQAGTPAISSAIQFVSLSQFGKRVKFLVSNEYAPELTKIIESSEYLRGINIQQVKALISSGSPGSASKLIEIEQISNIKEQVLTELEQEVNRFNLYIPTTSDINFDFTTNKTKQRIIDALNLITFFFENKNYIQGIALLAAAQETFMKVAVRLKVNSHEEIVTWKAKGLYLEHNFSRKAVSEKKSKLMSMNFPEFSLDNDQITLKSNDDFKVINRNYVLLAWLINLESSFIPWALLKWSCKDKRGYDGDRRNQLLHNLRGMEDESVKEYLLGYDSSISASSVDEAYENHVKEPFVSALQLFNLLPEHRTNLKQRLKSIANSIS